MQKRWFRTETSLFMLFVYEVFLTFIVFLAIYEYTTKTFGISEHGKRLLSKLIKHLRSSNIKNMLKPMENCVAVCVHYKSVICTISLI